MIESIYSVVLKKITIAKEKVVPYARRFVRFLALPYCYFVLVNWTECRATRLQVLKDLIYIFFTMKYFPDNYSYCRLWEKNREEWPYYYGSMYDPYQRHRLRHNVQPEEYKILFDDKIICYKLCRFADFPLPKVFGYITPHAKYQNMIKGILDSKKNLTLIIKPALGRGGAGIILAYKENKKYFVRDHGSESSLESFQCKNVSLIQEYVKQHNALDRISSSVNTIRIVTLLTLDGLAIIIGAFIRFGRSGNFIDNMCAGGIGVGVNLKNGTLMRRGIDFRGVVHEKHPDSNFIFEGIQIPFWQETTSLVKEIQLEFPCYKLLGHDIAITESGPKLIEINDSPDNVALEMTFGPILKDKDVRNEFKRHDLLINNLLFRQI